MAKKNTIKGLTIEIGGDTTKLGEALKDVDKKSQSLSSELGELNRLLKFDPGNTELLAQKQKVLSEAIEATSQRLATLKEAERQAQAQFERGEISEEQYRALQREVIATEGKLKKYKKEAEDTAKKEKEAAEGAEDLGDGAGKAKKGADKAGDSLDKMADKAEKAEKESSKLGGTLVSVAKTGLAALVAGLGAALTALAGTAEASREYRTAMSKLETASYDSELSSDSLTGAYKTLQGVLGETDQAVEASSFLAQLCEDEEQLADMTEALTGVYGLFGAALPVEGLAEAANESAKTGAVTGSLADALNWASLSSERWAGIIGETSVKAQEAFNAAVAEGENTEDAFNAALAACTDEQERAKLITNTLAGAYKDAAVSFRETNAEVIRANEANEAWADSMAEVGAEVEPILTDVKLLGASMLSDLVPGIKGVTTAFRGMLNGDEGAAADLGSAVSDIIDELIDKCLDLADDMVEMGTGLVTSLTSSLTASLPKLLTTGVDMASSILDGLTSAIPDIMQAIADMIPQLVDSLVAGIPQIIQGGVDLFVSLAESIPLIIPPLIEALPEIIEAVVLALVDAIPQIMAAAGSLFMGIVNAIPGIVVKLAKSLPQIGTTIHNALKELPAKVLAVGADLVTGLWNGVSNKLQWLKNKLSGFADSVLGGIKSFFGVHSPSTKTAWIGEMLDRGLADGVLSNANDPIKAMETVSSGVLGAIGTVDGVQLERSLQQTSTAAQVTASPALGIGDKLDMILQAIKDGQILTIDGNRLVGATAQKMDSKLGQRRALAARGAV